MRAYLKAAIAVTAVLILATTAQAAEDSWRIGLKPDNGAGLGSGVTSHFGVYPTSNDYLPPDGQDTVANYGTDISQTTIWAVGGIGDGNTYSRDIKAGDLVPFKFWHLRVAALPQSTYTQIRLNFVTISPAVLPPSSVGGVGVYYWLEMIDNRGVPGAPPNGWICYVQAITAGGYTVPDLLPAIKLSAPTHEAMMNEGYVLDFCQALPEPSSLFALGTGLMGLVGVALRRRRK